MVKKDTWGRYTWIFFHSVIYKLKNENDLEGIKTIIQFINTICNLIPCSICRTHALKYLKNNNISNMKTKTQLKLYMYTFHNYVNKRLNTEILNVKQCDAIYENKIFNTVLINFHKILKLIQYNANYMHLSRKKINFINTYISYFKHNMHKYNL